MECNKEEAVRAKTLAEEKMTAGDFVGAHKLATKAQRLFPHLENIQQMIAICDVHSSANKKMDDNNWYGILQVDHLSDADTIKKQYRKLTLLLHPDKNKFAGAESAFKLVGEANRLLSDKIQRGACSSTAGKKESHQDKKTETNGGAAAKKRSVSEVDGFDLDINVQRRSGEEMQKRTEEATNKLGFNASIPELIDRKEAEKQKLTEEFGGWPSSSTVVKKESQDQEPETVEAKKMSSCEFDIAERRRRTEERQKTRFEEATSRWASSSSTDVKKESHQDQVPGSHSPFASMHSNANSENVDTFSRCCQSSRKYTTTHCLVCKKPYIPRDWGDFLVPLPLPRIFPTAGKKESHQDQVPGSHSPFASMHSNANSYIPCDWGDVLPSPRIFPTDGKKESHQDEEEAAKKRSFSEVDGFDYVYMNEQKMRKHLEEATSKLGSEAERQKRMEEFEEKCRDWASTSSVTGKKESHQDQDLENGGEAKKKTSFEVDIAERRRRRDEDIRKRLEREKKTKNVHVKPDHSDAMVRGLAILWKEKIRIENPRSSSSSLDVLNFLHFIVAHRLHNSIINQEETTKLASSIAHHKEAPKLFQSLGLHNVIPEFVQELINTSQYVPAVRLICFFKLKGFSPLHLLKKEMESLLAQEKDGGKLRDILELLADYKLEIDIPRVLIVKLMGQRPDNQYQVKSNHQGWIVRD